MRQLVTAVFVGVSLTLAAMAQTPAGEAGQPVAEAASRRVTLVLRGGARVTGDLLREKADSLVMDLGYAVISIPPSEVLERLDDAGEQVSGGSSAPENAMYTEAPPGTSQDRPVKDLADDLGRSVALVTTPGGLGSSFAVDDKGHFVTNFHVIQGEQKITLTLARGSGGAQDRVKIENVRIAAVSPFLDLALLEADLPEGIRVTGLPLGFSDRILNGQPVFAIGNPLGLERTVSEGIISSARRSFEGQLFLQTTTPLNPGNSGGPLLNLRGEVVGVTNMKAGWFSEGLNFAIPVDTLKFFLRNRDVLAFDKDNPGTGFRYLPPPGKTAAGKPE